MVDDNVDWEAQMIEVTEQLEEETSLWAEECKGVPVQFMQFDAFLMDNQIQATVAFFVEKGLIDVEEYNVFVKRFLLKSMQELRPKIRNMRLEELQRRLTARPQMVIPKDKRRIH